MNETEDGSVQRQDAVRVRTKPASIGRCAPLSYRFI